MYTHAHTCTHCNTLRCSITQLLKCSVSHLVSRIDICYFVDILEEGKINTASRDTHLWSVFIYTLVFKRGSEICVN